MKPERATVIPLIAVAVLVLAAGAPDAASSAPVQTVTPDRQALQRARTFKPMVQRFAISGLVPAAGWKTIRGPQAAAAARAGADYQRRCAAGDPSTPARIDSVREPVAPGAVVQIAGDCFGTAAGMVTLAGIGPSAIRLAVQSWSNTAIAALVPSVPGARHQAAVLDIARSRGANTTGLLAKPAAPALGTVYTTGSGAAASLPSNEASVEFWPELEYRTVRSETIANRSCGFPDCLTGPDAAPTVAFGYACPPPCADHEAQAYKPSGVNGNGFHWLHEADDTWVVRHPAGWQVQQVNVLGRDGYLAIPPPKELSPEQTLLTFHWQDEHATYLDQESGTWFFAKYWFTVTVVGAKGTWHE